MKYHHALILGDARFLGSHLVQYMAKTYSCHMTIVADNIEDVAHLKHLPQVSIFVGDIDQRDVLDVAIRNVDVVINLTDVWYARKPSGDALYGTEFEQYHVTRTQNIIEFCEKYGIKRYFHLSAFGVSDPELTPYYQSKLDGEEIALRATKMKVTIFRPTIMFGPDDVFFRNLVDIQQRLMGVPLRHPESRFQPIFVGNVVQAITFALSHDESIGKVYSLVGPKTYTLDKLLSMAGLLANCEKSIWTWHFTSNLMLNFRLPKYLYVNGDYIFMQFANKCIDERIAQSFSADLHFSLRYVEDIIPNYLENAE